ncbi:hypothetical protein [Actinomadura sp. KC216]|uniref:hypothetical protein n=1 Tax=Actinomadura sp. KC216 TaxID=2530370 RepID=UPI001404D251|nr:hypothetical protein [Actinomadura sp. KC216]
MIDDPEVWVTLATAMQRQIRELNRLIRAAEKDGYDSAGLKEDLARAKRARDYVTAA